MLAYFKEKYNIVLQFPDAPLIQTKPRSKETFFPPELVSISQQKIGDYNDKIKSALADSMCTDPVDRKRYIQQKVQEVFPGNELLREFGLTLDTEMSRWQAERLNTPVLQNRQARKPDQHIVSRRGLRSL